VSVESPAGGPHHHHHFTRACVGLFLATAAVPANTASTGHGAAATDASTAAQPANDQRNQEPIIITGTPLFRDLQPERNLEQDAIESYGVSTIDELLGYIQGETGNDADQPLILVNGSRINDVDEIGAFPVEVLRSVEVLPRGAAVRAGGRPGQRVISINLKRLSKTATLTAAHKMATEGAWNGDRGEALATYVKGKLRANIALRAGDEDALLESERGVIQPSPFLPYSQTGNVIGYPNTSGEIDPLLSAIAGHIVTVAPVPAKATPALSDFLSAQASLTDLGSFRTLRPNSRFYDLNGSFAAPIAGWLNSSTTMRLSRNESHALRGLPAALFVLSPFNTTSPFSREVGLAFYGADPLRSRSERVSGEFNETLNATLGTWTGNFYAKRSESKDVTRIEQEAVFAPIALDNAFNPFATDLTGDIALKTYRTEQHNWLTLGQLVLNGPAATLPAGEIQATVEGRLAWNKLRSSSTFATFGNGTFSRNEQSIRGALDVPIASRANKFLPQLGELSADGEYMRVHYSDAGALTHYAVGLTWEPLQALRLRAEIERTDLAPTIELLGEPVRGTPGVRIFDPLTGETVDVTQITGGNPDLKPEKDRVRRLSALLRLVPKLNLQLNAEYTDFNRRNFVASLPEASAAVELAFPERYIRTNGVLTTVDLRPVNFGSDRAKRLRWGLSMNKRIGGSDSGAAVTSDSARSTPPTYFQLTANHSMVFSEKILIRPGLDPVSLLDGGAIGIGGSQVRHQLDGTAAINSGGIGARLGITWRGASRLDTRVGSTTDTLHFSPLMLINLRAFADMKRLLPETAWAKGLRASLDVINVTNHRQRVRDSSGKTPLQFQQAYRDPLGRTIEVELRKVF
jgi:hypothetical protein